MLQFKPKFKMKDIPKAPANSIVLLDGTVVLPTPDSSCVWLLPPMGRPAQWAEHHMRKRHEYRKVFQDFFDKQLDRFLDLFSIDKPEMFREYVAKLADDRPAAYAGFFPDYTEGYIKFYPANSAMLRKTPCAARRGRPQVGGIQYINKGFAKNIFYCYKYKSIKLMELTVDRYGDNIRRSL